MDQSASWFLVLSLLGALGYSAGFYLGNGPTRRCALGIGIALTFITIWGILQFTPDVAVHAMPVWLLSHIEGVGAVPFYMLIIGIAWARSQLPRQRSRQAAPGFPVCAPPLSDGVEPPWHRGH